MSNDQFDLSQSKFRHSAFLGISEKAFIWTVHRYTCIETVSKQPSAWIIKKLKQIIITLCTSNYLLLDWGWSPYMVLSMEETDIDERYLKIFDWIGICPLLHEQKARLFWTCLLTLDRIGLNIRWRIAFKTDPYYCTCQIQSNIISLGIISMLRWQCLVIPPLSPDRKSVLTFSIYYSLSYFPESGKRPFCSSFVQTYIN